MLQGVLWFVCRSPVPRSHMHRLVVMLAAGLVLLPLRAAAERLPIRAYTTADGLAHNEVNTIVRDSRGFMWFATGDGLSRFDGYTFTNYSVEQGLPHRRVTDLLETRSGELWVATFGGLVRFRPDHTPMFTTIVPADDDPRARPRHSYRSATIGSTFVARLAGTQHANRAGFGAERHANADFRCPWRHTIRQHTVNADRAERRGGRSEPAGQRGIEGCNHSKEPGPTCFSGLPSLAASQNSRPSCPDKAGVARLVLFRLHGRRADNAPSYSPPCRVLRWPGVFFASLRP